jgi:hypothetical protein
MLLLQHFSDRGSPRCSDFPGLSKIQLNIAVYPILRDRVTNLLPHENVALVPLAHRVNSDSGEGDR